jgi:sulfatase maturation enzyme AslB (radical SAM superfamily)
MNPNKSVECIAPFSSLYVTNAKIGLPCCIIKKKNDDANIDFDKDLNWNFNSTNKFYQDEFLSFGNDFAKYKDCQACYLPPGVENAATQKDMHNKEIINDLDYIKNPTVTNLHIKFSNLCNLACRMCDPFSSNLLFKDFTEFHITDDMRIDANKVITNIPKDSVLYKSIIDNLSNIRRLWFSGGETLLHDEVWEILKSLHNTGQSKNVTLQLNTNGTVKLSSEEIEILKSFKRLILHVSIDGIGNLAEYVRTNLNWNSWIENFKIYNENFNKRDHDFQIVTTVSTFNIHKLLEIRNYFVENFDQEIYMNFVYGPWPETVPHNISDRAKEYLLNLYRGDLLGPIVENYLKNKSTIDSSKITDMIDVRDNKLIANKTYKNYKAFRDVEPEWYNILKS